ncbi:MAG: hypothetical protein LAT55_11940, partial [Opitutales bacterium]|nr:hypothetical protein [Opitutales bacterium]
AVENPPTETPLPRRTQTRAEASRYPETAHNVAARFSRSCDLARKVPSHSGGEPTNRTTFIKNQYRRDQPR